MRGRPVSRRAASNATPAAAAPAPIRRSRTYHGPGGRRLVTTCTCLPDPPPRDFLIETPTPTARGFRGELTCAVCGGRTVLEAPTRGDTIIRSNEEETPC